MWPMLFTMRRARNLNSGNPVNSSMPNPPPRANAGTNTWLPVSRL